MLPKIWLKWDPPVNDTDILNVFIDINYSQLHYVDIVMIVTFIWGLI